MKTFLLLSLFVAFAFTPVHSEDATIEKHPFFASMIGGSWTEVGEMAQPQGAVSGRSTSQTVAILGGQWLQQDGKASFGSATWDWRWMFRLAKTQDGKEVVQARYIDTNGQVADYLGEIVGEGNVLRLVRSLSESVKNVVQVTNQADGSRLVEVALIDDAGKTSLQYKAVGKKDS